MELPNSEKKLTAQLAYPEDVKADTIYRDYDNLGDLPIELDIFQHSRKNRDGMLRLGEKIANICRKGNINFVLTHPVALALYPGLYMTGGENEKSFKRCMQIQEEGLDFGEALKNNGYNVYLTFHVMGLDKDYDFAPVFIERIRESCEKKGLKPVFEARAKREPYSPGSYDNILEDLIQYHKEKKDIVADIGHLTTYEPVEKIIPILEKNPITKVMHITSYYDTHQIPTIEELKPWKNIILQPQIEYILLECFYSKNEPLEKAKDRERKIWDNARKASEFSPFKRKFGYWALKRDHNRGVLDAFEKAKPIIEELFS